jgi:hypothetical protein
LLPPTRDETGLLVSVRAGESVVETSRLALEPTLVASHPGVRVAGACLWRGFNDGSVRFRSAKLDNALEPSERDGALLGPPLSEEERAEAAAEYWNEKHGHDESLG